MRFLLLLFLCLSHLALSVDITISSVSINGKVYKNPTVSYDDGGTTATIFHDAGVFSVHITQIPHSILPKLGLSPDRVLEIMEKQKTIAKKQRKKFEAFEKRIKEQLSEDKKRLHILKNASLAYFTPTEFLPELGNCYLGTFSFDTSTKVLVIIPSNSEYKASNVDFSLNKKYPIMVIQAGNLTHNNTDFLVFRYVCERFEYKDELKYYSDRVADEKDDE